MKYKSDVSFNNSVERAIDTYMNVDGTSDENVKKVRMSESNIVKAIIGYKGKKFPGVNLGEALQALDNPDVKRALPSNELLIEDAKFGQLKDSLRNYQGIRSALVAVATKEALNKYNALPTGSVSRNQAGLRKLIIKEFATYSKNAANYYTEADDGWFFNRRIPVKGESGNMYFQDANFDNPVQKKNFDTWANHMTPENLKYYNKIGKGIFDANTTEILNRPDSDVFFKKDKYTGSLRMFIRTTEGGSAPARDRNGKLVRFTQDSIFKNPRAAEQGFAGVWPSQKSFARN